MLNSFSESKENKQKIWFTSDWHLNHHNIIRYCNRPFKNIDEMNMTLIDNFKNVVGPNDLIYFLGDMHMPPRRYCKSESFVMLKEIIDSLPGKKILIRGNHDKGPNYKYIESGFCQIHTFLKLEKNNIGMVHDPKAISSAQNQKRNLKWLAGHVHGNWKFSIDLNCLNVSVDVHDFFPLNLSEVEIIFNENCK